MHAPIPAPTPEFTVPALTQQDLINIANMQANVDLQKAQAAERLRETIEQLSPEELRQWKKEGLIPSDVELSTDGAKRGRGRPRIPKPDDVVIPQTTSAASYPDEVLSTGWSYFGTSAVSVDPVTVHSGGSALDTVEPVPVSAPASETESHTTAVVVTAPVGLLPETVHTTAFCKAGGLYIRVVGATFSKVGGKPGRPRKLFEAASVYKVRLLDEPEEMYMRALGQHLLYQWGASGDHLFELAATAGDRATWELVEARLRLRVEVPRK